MENFEKYIGEPDKERLFCAFKRKKVDRVPNLEGLIDEKIVEKILGRSAGTTAGINGIPGKGPSKETIIPMNPDDYIDICNIIGQDVVRVVGGLWTPFKKYNQDGELIPVADKSVKNRKDFEKIILDSKSQIEFAVKYVKKYKEALKNKNSKIGVFCVYGCILQTIYEFVVGFEDFMVMSMDDIDLIDEMLELSTQHFVNFTKEVLNAGVDFIGLGDDIAFKTGIFISPKIIKKIWIPRIARIIEPAVNAGKGVFLHSDGNIEEIVDDLISIGVDCINPLDPYAIDYRDFKKKFGNRICISGNMDIILLAKGTPEEIKKNVKEHMEVLKPGFGYVASSSHSILNYIPFENFVAYINAIHEYGKY